MAPRRRSRGAKLYALARLISFMLKGAGGRGGRGREAEKGKERRVRVRRERKWVGKERGEME